MSEDPPARDQPGVTDSQVLDPESTFRLLERVRAGDQDALERLLARHLKPLRRWARGRLPQWARTVADTDDLVQDTLIRTVSRLNEFEVRGAGSLQAYMRQAVVNRLRSELRRQGRRPEEIGFDGLELDGQASPLEAAIGRESLRHYERAMAALAPGEREAIIGRVEMGYSYEELAEALGKPSAEAARKATRRALIRLVQEMRLPDK
jgi:RNA polymerase sigma factor (sigma-70 family)